MVRPDSYRTTSRFIGDERGAVALIFGLTLMVLFAAAGGAIDYGRAVHARYQIQEAVDSAVLAGARVWQTENNLARAETSALAHYQQNKPEQMESQVSQFTPNIANRTLSMQAIGRVPTPFLSTIGIKSYEVNAQSVALLTSGGSADSPVEVAMMLDSTQGMAGDRLKDLKTAAKDFVEMLLADGSNYTRIALAPYAEGVRPGAPYFDNVVEAKPSQGKFENEKGKNATYQKTECTAERNGNKAYTAAAPAGNDMLTAIYTTTGNCTPGLLSPVVPLTSNETLLKTAISLLSASGLNGGHIGVGWTWYLLSPDWSSVWPAASRPSAYGTVQKVAILMTSGEWAVAYDASGVATRDSGHNTNNGASDTYSRQLCDNMKAAGVVVYTIGFDLKERRAISNMQDCASDPSKFYQVADGAKLMLAYRDIALRISKLRLLH
jgi:Flp pilus assembly protein TadG